MILKIQKLLQNIKKKKLWKSSEIQEISLAYLVHNHPKPEEVDNDCKLFARIDKKGSGKITNEDLFNGLDPLYKNENFQDDIDKNFENLDTHSNKYLEYKEFIRITTDKCIFLTDDSLKFAFI